MAEHTAESSSQQELRERAEAAIQHHSQVIPDMSVEGIDKLVHELQTHQIELEMQNEELRRAQEELAESRDTYASLYDLAPVGYATLSDKGLILKCNLTLCDWLGKDRSLAINSRLSTFVVDDDQDGFFRFKRHLVESRERQTCELRMHREGADPFWTRLDGVTAETTVNGTTELRLAISDIDARKQAEQQVIDSQVLYQSVVDHIPQMIFRKDRTGRVTFANRPLCELLSLSLDKILGRTDFNFYPRALAGKYREDDVRVIETGQVFDDVVEHRAADGQTRYMRILKSPIRDFDEQIVGVQGIFWDITDRQQSRMALKQSDRRLREAQRVGKIGSFDSDVHNDELWWSEELFHLFGLDPTGFAPTKESFTTLLHPDDKVAYIAALMDSLASGEPLKREYRARRSSGEWRHFETIANVTFDQEGQVLGLRGTV